MNRILNGLKLYQGGKVSVDHEDDELMIFNVHGSKDEIYQVSIYDNFILCQCDDYQYRAPNEPGSYICKHAWAALFKVTEMYKFQGAKLGGPGVDIVLKQFKSTGDLGQVKEDLENILGGSS